MQRSFTRLPYIVCYLCAFVLGMKQLREPDMWWQLLSGKWMLEHGAVTKQDMFSYTMQGTRWINVKWLYEVIIAAMEKVLGPHGVMLLQSLVNVLIVYLLLRILFLLSKHVGAQVSTFFSTLAVLAFLAVSESRMAGRPEMMSHLLTAVYLFILWRSEGYAWKKILWLIPLQCLWANLHEGYPVGMVLMAVFTGGSLLSYLLNKNKEYLQSATRLGIVWIGMALAILANPNTIQLWLQPFEIFRQLETNKYTTELFSFTDARYWTTQAYVHVVLLAAVLLFWIYRINETRRVKNGLQLTPLLAGYLLLLPVFGYLSLTANRNIPFAQIALFPSVPVMLAWLVSKLNLSSRKLYINAAKRTVIISTIAAALFYVSVVSNAWYKTTDSPNRYGLHVSILHNPTGAAEFIKRHNLQGPAFSDYFVSSYLLWDLYPDFKSYIDLRDLDIFPAKFFDEYFTIYSNPSKFYLADSTYKFNYIVLSTSQLTALQQMLYWGEGFNVVYIDPVTVIFFRNVEENAWLNKDLSIQRLFTWPQDPIDPGWAEALSKLFNPAVAYPEEEEENAPIHAARFYNMVKNYPISRKLLLPAVQTVLADDVEALALMGHTYMGYSNYVDEGEKAKQLDSARLFFERALDVDADYSNAHLGLADLLMMKGDFATAKQHLAVCKEQEQKNDFVFYMYGLCCRNLWHKTGSKAELQEVIESMERCIELNDRNDKARLYLAEAYWHKGDKNEARDLLKRIDGENVPWLNHEKELYDRMKKLAGI